MFARKGIAHVDRREIEGVQPFVVEPDANRALDLSADEYVADAIDGFEAGLDDLLGIGVELLYRAVALQRHPDYRRGAHLDLAHDRRVGGVRQAFDDRIHLGFDLLIGHVQVFFEIELDSDHRRTERGTRCDGFDAGDLVAGLFHNVSDILVHDIRVGALHGGGHGDRREIDFRKAVEPETRQADDAEQYEHQAHHQGEYVSLDGKFRQRHAAALSLSLSTGASTVRSEERRGGKERSTRWSPYHSKIS